MKTVGFYVAVLSSVKEISGRFGALSWTPNIAPQWHVQAHSGAARARENRGWARRGGRHGW